ncbi:MraY family glycosyltransferase [Spirochaetia bacterium 38H-sp]|uniref:MraY family glycosyltransferase n=1 Tax=Rarispira pelagica TaxID=3141764 RepID=A0ABU9UBU9_9SPIR
MISYIAAAFVGLVLAFIISVGIIPYIIRISHKKGWFDPKDSRKLHSGDISRLGGIGIFLGFFIAFIVVYIAFGFNGSEKFSYDKILLISGVIIMFITGVLDDFFFLKARIKLAGQIIAAIIIVFLAGYYIKSFIVPILNVEISLGLAGQFITVFWILAVVNAVNLIDGMDGLASSIVITAIFFLNIISFLQSNYVAMLIGLTYLGSMLGFLRYNFPPAKIFMGDGGSHFIGTMLAIMPFIIYGREVSSFALIPVLLLLSIPVFDTFFAILRRVRKNVSIGIADKEHIHHKLIALGLTDKKILFWMSFYTAVMGVISVYWVLTQSTAGMLIALLGGAAGGVFFIIISSAYHKMQDKTR